MKRLNYFLFCIVALGMIFFQSCSKDTFAGVNEPTVNDEGKLSFVLPMKTTGGVTYATKSIDGLDEEYVIENLFIYWFTDDGGTYKLLRTFSTDDNSIAVDSIPLKMDSNNNSTIATIAIGANNDPSRFYIVANVNKSTSVKSTDLQNITLGTSDVIFAKYLTDALKANAASGFDKITTPLPMSINNNSTNTNISNGYIDVSSPQIAGIINNVNLKRRVARFDIMNNVDYSNFQVTKIHVSHGQRQGFIQDIDFTGNESWKTAAGDGNMVFDASWANGVQRSAKIDEETWDNTVDPPVQQTPPSPAQPTDPFPDDIYDDFQGPKSQSQLDSLELNKAVFYLWPTVLTQDPSTGTEIIVEGTYTKTNVTKLYKLILPGGNPLDIAANNIYKIKITRTTEKTIGFEIIADHWEAETEITTQIPTGSITWSDLKIDDGTPGGSLAVDLTSAAAQVPNADLYYEYSSKDSIKLFLQTEGLTGTIGADKGVINIQMKMKNGQIEDVDYRKNDWDSTKLTTNIHRRTVVTYGTQFISYDTIILPQTNAPLEYIIELKNPANETDNRVIRMKSLNIGRSGATFASLNTIYTDDANPLPLNLTNRFEKALAMSVDSADKAKWPAMPTKYGSYRYGKLKSVVGIVGTIENDAIAQSSNLPPTPGTAMTIDQWRNYLATTSDFVPNDVKTRLVNLAGMCQTLTNANVQRLISALPNDCKQTNNTQQWYNILLVMANSPYYPIVESPGVIHDVYSNQNNMKHELASDVGIKIVSLVNY